MRRSLLLLPLALVLLPLALAFAALPALAADTDRLAESLATLRGEVETLSTELELAKEELRGRLRALDAQEAELQVQVRHEELRLEQVAQALEAEQARRAESAEANAVLKEPVRSSIAQVREAVSQGLPFRTGERLAALDELEQQLADGTLTPQESAVRLWAFVEDEQRLSRENAVDRQPITLYGQQRLVDVARLGMVALYYRTDDGQLGVAVRQGETWGWRPLEQQSERQQVLELFDALEKQIRTGFFVLPNALTEVR